MIQSREVDLGVRARRGGVLVRRSRTGVAKAEGPTGDGSQKWWTVVRHDVRMRRKSQAECRKSVKGLYDATISK